VGSIGLTDTSVASDVARLPLELAAVATVSLLTLRWLRINRGRIELTRAQPMHATVSDLAVSTSTAARRKNLVKIATSGGSVH
jgi:hypothetical protein